MKVRVYDGAKPTVYDRGEQRKERKQYEDSVDRYSLYFPLPKKRINKDDGVVGCYLGFSFSDDGEQIIRCTFEEWNSKNGLCDHLGKKAKIETLPENVQKWIADGERVYNEFIKHPDDEKAEKEWMMW